MTDKQDSGEATFPLQPGTGVLAFVASAQLAKQYRYPPLADGAETLVMTKVFLRHDEKSEWGAG